MEFGFDLESRLHDGCVIHQTPEADYIVRQEHEPVFVLRPGSAEEAALQGWMIGNLHMGVEITGGEIRAMHDPRCFSCWSVRAGSLRNARCCSTLCVSPPMLPDWLPWLLQVNDSQFPSGAYAHSLGLEGMTQLESVRTAADLKAFLRRQIAPSLLAFELPYVRRAHAAAASENVEALRALDDELEAWKLAAELRAASRQIGSRRLALVRKLCPGPVLRITLPLEPPAITSSSPRSSCAVLRSRLLSALSSIRRSAATPARR